MLILFTGYKEDRMGLEIKSLAMRLCYLYADQFRMAGNIHHFFYFDDMFKKMKLEEQVKFLAEHEELTDAETVAALIESKATIKKEKKLAKTREFIHLSRKRDAAVQQMFNSCVDDYLQPLRTARIPELKSLLNKPTFECYNIDQRSPEQKTDRDDSLLSDILQLDLDEEDLVHPALLFLGDHLFKDGFTAQLPHNIPMDVYSANGFLVELLTLSDYTFFSLEQIDALRNNLLASLEPFRKTVGKFAEMTADTEMAYNYLKAVVVPAAAALQEAHDADKSIAILNAATQQELVKIKLYAGMLPANVVYQYFKHIEVLTTKTEKLLVEAGAFNKMIPVLVSGIPYYVNAPAAAYEVAQAYSLPLKKTLMLD